MKIDTGEHIKSFDRAAMDKAVDKSDSMQLDLRVGQLEKVFVELTDKNAELQREISRLEDKVNWINGQGKVGTVWVIEKDKK